MRRVLCAGASGLLFGLGLVLSGMTDPAKILGFLDITRQWDPSLALVMAAAVPVFAVAALWARGTAKPVCAAAYVLPEARPVDARLVGGAAMFGIGWGLAGYCPGPALAALAGGMPQTWLFAASMGAGMGVFAMIAQKRAGAV